MDFLKSNSTYFQSMQALYQLSGAAQQYAAAQPGEN